jgi:hypothetical protein
MRKTAQYCENGLTEDGVKDLLYLSFNIGAQRRSTIP